MIAQEYTSTLESELKEQWVVSDHDSKKLLGQDQDTLTQNPSTDKWINSWGQVAGAAIFAAICSTSSTQPEDTITSLHKNASLFSTTNSEPLEYYRDARALLIDELRQYEFLETGWDGGKHDQAPSSDAINEAILFLESLPPFVPLPEAMATSDGEVGFYWNDGRIYLDIGFRGIQQCVFYGKCEGIATKGAESIATGKMLPTKLAKFISESFLTDVV